MADNYRFDTACVTGGFNFDPATGATNPPLHLSNAYRYKDADHASSLFKLEEAGHIYTRLHNPTTDVLETRIAELEGGVGAVATATGHFAEAGLFMELCKAGDEIVASGRLYGGTMNMLSKTLPRFGISSKFADQNDPSTWEAQITSHTKAFYLESLANPDSSIPDFEGIAEVAEKYKIPVIVDNTMATPYLFRPKDFGANIIIHSGTKYLCGNGTVMGGLIVDLGNFDWAGSGRFDEFNEPDPSYNGLNFVEAFKESALGVRLRAKTMRDIGGTPSPFNSYMILLGLQTLHLRMPRHVENAKRVGRYLMTNPNVKAVNYPGFEENARYGFAQKYFPKGPGGMLTFEANDYETAKRVIENVKLCVHTANLGDARTILTHPASTTHSQVSAEGLTRAGISREMVRVSVGIEDAEDIIEDLEQALKG